MLCPDCGHDNIPGIELCESCGVDLAGLDTPEAQGGLPGRLLSDRIADLPLSPALTAAPETTVSEAVATLRRERHGCLMVTEEDRLAGIFTERDLLSRVIRPGLASSSTTLEQVMTRRPVTLQASDPPAFAANLMVERGIRHLPVLDGDRILGFVSVRNLLRYIQHGLGSPDVAAEDA